jgi:uncharacterized protein with GYD domain
MNMSIEMPHYIVLFNFTDQGIRNIKDTIKRAEAFKNSVEKAGGKFVSEYYTFGKYDIVTTVEAPDDQTMMSIMLSTGSLGNVRSETLKAFPMEEAGKIIERL